MPNDTQPTEEQLKQAITESLQKLYDKDENLISRFGENDETKHVHERGIVFRFGIYFQRFIDTHQWFQTYNIDVEYNRNKELSKATYYWKNGTYPDFIVHRREKNSTTQNPCNNLLILEFKTYDNKSDTNDRGNEILHEKLPNLSNNGRGKRGAIVDYLKILDFMRQNENPHHQYLYCYGVSIIIAKQEPPEWCWINGNTFRENEEQTVPPDYKPVW